MPCSATTRRGDPCRGTPLPSLDVCIAHAPEEVKQSRGFGGSQPGAGRPPKPKATDILRERMEADADAILDALWGGLKAQRGLAVGNGPSARVEYVDDVQTQVSTAEKIIVLGYGRPNTRVELTGADGGPVTFADLAARADG